MLVMISQPMNGIPDEEVLKIRKILTEEFNKIGIEVAPSFINDEISSKETKNPSVFYLGRTIMTWLHKVDAVYFVPGWEKARGCVIEHEICKLYNIKILYEDFLKGAKNE